MNWPFFSAVNQNLNAIKNHVSDGDVATEVKRLIALGQKEGYILFAGSRNTGLPPSATVGAVHYVQFEGASVIYLEYMYNFEVYYGRLESTSNTPVWDGYVLKSDLKTLAKVDRSNDVAWVGDENRNMIFTCRRAEKSLTVTFADGSTVTFAGV